MQSHKKIDLGIIDISDLKKYKSEEQEIILSFLASLPVNSHLGNENKADIKIYEWQENNIIYNFQFKDNFIKVKGQEHFDENHYWIFSPDEKLGVGASGAVVPIKAKMTTRGQKYFYKAMMDEKQKRKKVIKIINNNPDDIALSDKTMATSEAFQEYSKTKKQKARMENETKIASLLPEINAKQTIVNSAQSFIIMNDVSGKTLFISTEKENLNLLDWLNVFLLTANKLRSLHDRNIIHNDIKPDNIMINDEKSQAIIIDFNLSKMGENKNYDYEDEGAPQYKSPEKIKTKISDVYGLGKTLEYIVKYANSLNGIAIPLDLELLIKDMMKPDPKERPNLDQVIAILEDIAFKIKLENINNENKHNKFIQPESLAPLIKQANTRARLAAASLREVELKSLTSPINNVANVISSSVLNNFKDVADNPSAIKEFFSTLGVLYFKSTLTLDSPKKMIEAQLRDEINGLVESIAYLQEQLKLTLDDLNKKKESAKNPILMQAYHHTHQKIESLLFANVLFGNEKFTLTIDNLVVMNEKLKKAGKQYDRKNNYNINIEECELVDLKNKCKKAIQAYLEQRGLKGSHHSTDIIKSMGSLKLVNDRRKQEIVDFYRLISKANTCEELINGLQNKIGKKSKSIFKTSDHSADNELNEKLEDVLDEYKEANRMKKSINLNVSKKG